MLGQIEFEEFKPCKFTQRAASAWSAGMDGICGADYEPLLYVGKQLVNGTNYFFIAGQTLTTRIGEKHIVKLTINEKNNVYKLISVEKIF